MANLFAIVKSDCSRFGALSNLFKDGNPDVINANMDRIETLLEAIEYFSPVVDGPQTIKPPRSAASRICPHIGIDTSLST